MLYQKLLRVYWFFKETASPNLSMYLSHRSQFKAETTLCQHEICKTTGSWLKLKAENMLSGPRNRRERKVRSILIMDKLSVSLLSGYWSLFWLQLWMGHLCPAWHYAMLWEFTKKCVTRSVLLKGFRWSWGFQASSLEMGKQQWKGRNDI